MASVRLEHDIWVLVADGEKALFLRNEGDDLYPHLEVIRELHETNPPTHDQGTDRPGRFQAPEGPRRSAVQETDWHRIEKERFAKEMAERLYKLAHRGRFRKLVLVAPPLVLGEMRKEIHKEVASKVSAEVAKTLTNMPVDEMERVLKNG